jgi:rubrerythrin
MKWPSVPALPPAYAWDGDEGPETAPFDSLHYLMQPWHALEIALRCERDAQQYYENIAASRAPKKVRDTAREMASEEAEHVRLIREWMKRVPRPGAGWDEDPDPPRTTG